MDVKRLAIFAAPHTGGIFTFYRRFSDALRDLGVQVCSIELEGEAPAWHDYAPELAGPEHRVLSLGGESGAAAGKRIAAWLERERIDTVVLTPMSPDVVYDTLPHLPSHIRVLVRLTEISHHSYRRALRRPSALDGVIALCPRQADDVEGLAQDVPCYILPNGVDVEKFMPAQLRQVPGDTLRLLVLDRLVHIQKRILLLPKLCRELDALGVRYRLTVAGDGPDADKLRTALKPWADRETVQLVGRVAPENVPALMAAHDVYLKLSHNEGSPNAVLEAMAAGLAPVAVRIRGVTDFIIQDGVCGRLVPVDDMPAMASALAELDADRPRLAEMQRAARRHVADNFSMARFRARISDLLAALPERSARAPQPWDQWTSSAPRHGWLRQRVRRMIPLSWRVALRERFLGLPGAGRGKQAKP